MQLPKIRYQTRNFRGENPTQQGLKSRNRDFTDIKRVRRPYLVAPPHWAQADLYLRLNCFLIRFSKYSVLLTS